MLPLVLRTGMGVLRTNNLRLQVVRCAVHSLGTGMWFLALPLVPLAEITAISFTSPIFLAIGAILFFGEKVRGERWIAIGIGFLGVMIVLYPKLEHGIAANWASLLLIAAAPVSASSYLLAKRLMRYDKTETIVLWQAMLVSLFTLPIALFFWRADDAARSSRCSSWSASWARPATTRSTARSRRPTSPRPSRRASSSWSGPPCSAS